MNMLHLAHFFFKHSYYFGGNGLHVVVADPPASVVRVGRLDIRVEDVGGEIGLDVLADLVVRPTTTFLGVDAGRDGGRDRCTQTMRRGTGQHPATSVKGKSNDEFWLGHAGRHPCLHDGGLRKRKNRRI